MAPGPAFGRVYCKASVICNHRYLFTFGYIFSRCFKTFISGYFYILNMDRESMKPWPFCFMHTFTVNLFLSSFWEVIFRVHTRTKQKLILAEWRLFDQLNQSILGGQWSTFPFISIGGQFRFKSVTWHLYSVLHYLLLYDTKKSHKPRPQLSSSLY